MDESVDLEDAGVCFSHLNGCIFKLCPVQSFAPLHEGESLTFKFSAHHYSASRSDILPNWYIHVDGLQPRVIKCTEGESLDFVGSFDTPKRYKRFDYVLASGKRRYDIYQPFTSEVRFFRYPEAKVEAGHLKSVIPTPARFDIKSDRQVNVSQKLWNICFCDGQFLREAKFLSGKDLLVRDLK